MATDLPNLKVACSGLTGTIYAGYVRENSAGRAPTWTRRADVTKDAINAVIEHLLHDGEKMEWEFVNDDSKVTIRIEREPLPSAKGD